MAHRFIATSRGGESLVVDNYLYRLNNKKGTVKNWKCCTQECKATAQTDGEVLVRSSDVGNHSHPDDSIEISRREFRKDVKDTVVQQPTVSIKRSYTQALSDLPIADAAKMPSFSAVRDSGYRCGIFSNS